MLVDGTLEGSNVKCRCHGSTYDLKTGAIVKGPTTAPEPSYRVKIDNGAIYVEV